ncbi:MAG: hypothetical protein RIC29_00480 [Rhodospirillaceae bacterium]
MNEDQYFLFESSAPLRLTEILEALVGQGIVRVDGNSPMPAREKNSINFYPKVALPEPKRTITKPGLTDLANKVGRLLEIDLSPLMASKGQVKVNDVLSYYTHLKMGDS